MSQVQTTQGLVDRELLDCEDISEEGENNRVVATVWRLKSTGEMVRRDVHVIVFKSFEVEITGGR